MVKFAFSPPRLNHGYSEPSGPDTHEHHFGISDDDGHIGTLIAETDKKKPKEVRVLSVQTEDRDPNSIGTRHVRHLTRKLKEHFPEAEHVTGRRISGARTGGKYDESRKDEVRVKLR